MASARIDEAARRPVAKDMVQAGLIAGNAGIDAFRCSSLRFGDKRRVCQERTGHADHVRFPLGEDRFGILRHVDAVHRDDGGRLKDILHPRRCPGITAARYCLSDRGDARFVPPDPGIDDVGARLFDHGGQHADFLKRAAAFDDVQDRQAIHDDKVRPSRLPNRFHDAEGQTGAVFKTAAPAIGALVCAGRGELVQQIAFGAHDLDPVISGFFP